MLNIFSSSPLKDGLKLMQDNRFPEAIIFFTKLLQEKPNLAFGYLNIAKCHFALQNYEDAKTNLLKALELDPGEEMARAIIEITNWKMVSPPKYFNGSPSFSRDGKKLVYTSVRKGAEEGSLTRTATPVYIFTISRSGQETCVVPDNYNNSFPVFSPIRKKNSLSFPASRPAAKAGASRRTLTRLTRRCTCLTLPDGRGNETPWRGI